MLLVNFESKTERFTHGTVGEMEKSRIASKSCLEQWREWSCHWLRWKELGNKKV